jgi:hypothetical protein
MVAAVTYNGCFVFAISQRLVHGVVYVQLLDPLTFDVVISQFGANNVRVTSGPAELLCASSCEPMFSKFTG